MKISNHSSVPVYTVAGSSTARPLPEWLMRKRKRSLKQDPEFAQRIELLQEFEFEEASSCVRVSEDGDWVMSTGTYKPQIHTHYLPHLSLSWARHTNTVNETFVLLSSDYSKSLHLQTDRFLEFHTPQGCHYTTRIPRYGRDLKYDKQSTEALIPSVGVNSDGNGEVYRLNLELGRFMKGYEVDVGGDDYSTIGGGALQGGINTGSVNTAAIAEDSHNLLAFGTSLGTVEFFDPRSKHKVGLLASPAGNNLISTIDGPMKPEITALEFHQSGLTLAAGTSSGLIHLYDLRSPVPLLKKDQGYGFPIKTLTFLDSTASTRAQTAGNKILSSDKRIIKIWDRETGAPWTSVEPAVDMNHVAWCKDSGMLLTANEGRQQHAFFIPQLGPAPRWCAFLDNLVEEMAEDAEDPAAFNGNKALSGAGEVYDNYKFLTMEQLRALNLEHLIGTTALLRPYMHGFFVAQRLYEEARLIANPDLWREQRAKNVQDKIAKERESRIRGNKKAAVKVNRRLAERLLEREEKNERRKARRVLKQGGDDDMVNEPQMTTAAVTAAENDEEADEKPAARILNDPRFSKLFEDEDFAVDENSTEFKALNPAARPTESSSRFAKGLTAVDHEELDDRASSSLGDESSDDSDEEYRQRYKQGEGSPDQGRISSASYKKTAKQRKKPTMVVSSSSKTGKRMQSGRHLSFGARAAAMEETRRSSTGPRSAGRRGGDVVGEKEMIFQPAKKEKRRQFDESTQQQQSGRKGRRSASGNTFRRM